MLGVIFATILFVLVVVALIMNFKKIVRWIKNIK